MAAAHRWRSPAPENGHHDTSLRSLIASRAVLVITVLAILSAATGALALASSTGTSNASPAATEQEQRMGSGAPFQDPPEADVAAGANGDLTVTLDAHDTQFDLAGKTVLGQSYNGSYVAPTIRFDPGAQVDVRLVNHLPVATDVHFHGLHLDPADHSGDEFVCVAPGGTSTYHLMIPANHPQGTYWYHSHAMGATCAASTGSGSGAENQVFAGLSGALIVGDDRTLLPAAYRHIIAHTFILKDFQTGAAATMVRLVNSQLRPVVTMAPNETQLWRLINAGADISYRLRMDGYAFTVVGEDGVPATDVTTVGALVLAPGKCYDVLVTANRTPGTAWLRSTSSANGPQGDPYPDATLVELDIGGRAVSRLPLLTGVSQNTKTEA